MRYDALEAIKAMSDRVDQSLLRTSMKLGLAPSYLSNILSRGSFPRIDTYNKIANAFGYTVQLVNHNTGDVIELEEFKED